MNLKRAAQRKLKKSGGFTLVEMLIVVAIIAILVVVSIPLVSNSLEKARQATDDANVRAAKAAAMIEYMLEDEAPATPQTYYYDAADGTVQGDNIGIKGYNQMKQGEVDPKKGCVVVTISSGTATATWGGAATPGD